MRPSAPVHAGLEADSSEPGRSEQRLCSGFSLVEILLAVTILAFVALGIAALFTRSMTLNASGYDYAQLSAQARRTLEELAGLPYDHARLEPTSSAPYRSMSGHFEVRYTVTEYAIGSWADLEPGVSWPLAVGGNGNVKRVTLAVRSTLETGRIGRRELTVSTIKLRRRVP